MTTEKIIQTPKQPNEHAVDHGLEPSGFGLDGFVTVRRLHVILGMASAFLAGLVIGAYLVGYVMTKFGTR